VHTHIHTHTHTQAQQGVQRKNFTALEELVNYYSQPRRGLVCGLTVPLEQQKEEEEPQEESGDCHVTVIVRCFSMSNR